MDEKTSLNKRTELHTKCPHYKKLFLLYDIITFVLLFVGKLGRNIIIIFVSRFTLIDWFYDILIIELIILFYNYIIMNNVFLDHLCVFIRSLQSCVFSFSMLFTGSSEAWRDVIKRRNGCSLDLVVYGYWQYKYYIQMQFPIHCEIKSNFNKTSKKYRI